jgi:predicted branched-subunit amino acid permease
VSGHLPPTPRGAFTLGAREMLPGVPAIAALALVTGVAMAKSALTLNEGIGMSLIAYAGAAQLAALPLMVAGAPIVVTVLSALMVNLRFVIYSAALAPALDAAARKAARPRIPHFGHGLRVLHASRGRAAQ